MLALTKRVLRPLYDYLTCANFREYIRLLNKYKDVPRFIPENVRFLNYGLKAVDCLSFICQFEEIWMNEIYKFDCQTESPVIYDCGANIGMSVLYFKKIFPRANIKAFESDPQIFRILEMNLKKNNICDIQLFNKAVWTENGSVEFGTDGADGGSIFLKTENKIKVQAVRLKDLIAKEREVDMLKIDIEGAETKVIADMSEMLGRVKNLFVEYHSFSNEGQRLDLLLSVLSGNGFRYYMQTVSQRNGSPFINRGDRRTMDMQANIFAYRPRA